MKPSWRALVELLNRYEKDCPERFRYPKVHGRDKAGNNVLVRSFDARVEIPIEAMLAHLRTFMREAAEILPPEQIRSAEDWSALQDLGLEGEGMDNKLYSRGLL